MKKLNKKEPFLNALTKTLANLEVAAFLPDIYKEFEDVCSKDGVDLSHYGKYKGKPNFITSVRRVLQHNAATSSQYIENYPDKFIGPFPKKKGYWELKTNKRCAYICTFYLSKFLDHNGEKNFSYRSLGFSSRKEAAKVLSEKFGIVENNIKNFEDSFDSVNDNHRKGWYRNH